MDKYFNVNFICATNINKWWSNHALMSRQLLWNQHIPPPKDVPPLLRQTTNDIGVCEQTTVPGCAQTTLAALAKRQFGGLERHLCHTLELGISGEPEAILFYLECTLFNLCTWERTALLPSIEPGKTRALVWTGQGKIVGAPVTHLNGWNSKFQLHHHKEQFLIRPSLVSVCSISVSLYQ